MKALQTPTHAGESSERPSPSNRAGFTSIFDGKTLDGWRAVPQESVPDAHPEVVARLKKTIEAWHATTKKPGS